jgi:hypothetical protein
MNVDGVTFRAPDNPRFVGALRPAGVSRILMSVSNPR